MKLKRFLASILAMCMVLSTMSTVAFAEEVPADESAVVIDYDAAAEVVAAEAVAKVGNTEYATIDEAVANWTNNTTLTLLANVTLSDVIKLSSTEYHILDLGTYTMTAAKNKDAIQYVVNGRSSMGVALDIKADATNPGGITATGGSVVRHTKPLIGAVSKDRPITRFYGGVFNASYVVRQGGTLGAGYTGASAPAFYFYDGEYNGTIYTNRSINQFYGGTFNGSMQMSVDSSAYTLIAGGTFKNLSNLMGSELNSDKFTIGSSKGANNGSVCIDENGNYVITTSTPAEAEASVASNYNSSNYFYYSTVNTNGMYYEDVYDALEKNTSGTVTVYTDELDMSNVSNFTGTIVVPEGEEITIIVAEGATPAWTVESAVENEEPNVTYEDTNDNELVKNEDGSFVKPDTGETNADVIVEGVDVEIEPVDGVSNSYEITLAEGATWTDGGSVTMTFPAVEGATDGDSAYVVHEHEGVNYIYVGKVADGSVTITNTVGFSTFTVYEGGLADALTAASAITGDVTVEIYDKVTLNQNLSGSYSSITFIGKDEDAEIYMEIDGYIEASGKDVSFTDLKLSKSAGPFVNNAGFMNVAFGVYSANTVTYKGCTFANGAYASNGKNTFTGCTFYRSHDKYGLWAYGNVDVVVDGCTFADYRGIKMYAEGAAKTVDLTVKNTDFSAVTDKPAIVLTYGKSVTLEENTYSSTGVFELDLDGAPNGTPVASDVAPTCKNDNGACGVLVDGKIYTTVAQAAEVAAEGSKVTLLHNSTETVEFVEGVNLDKNGYTADSVTVKKSVVASVNGVEYGTLEGAFNAAQAGDEIVLLADVEGDITIPADVIFNGNGFTVSGGIIADGDITFAGITKAKDFDVKYVGTVINIGRGVTLELTGADRLVVGHGCTFNIEGNIADAKTANVADLTPSLIVAAGASFTGTNLTFNVTNAYIKFNKNSTSKNNAANGTFNFNITNSIWEQTGVLGFYVPTEGMDPTFNFNLKDSVLNSTSHLVFAVTKGEIVVDNSNVNSENNKKQLENRSNLTIKNGSVVYASVATSENAKNPGTLTVDNATYIATGEFSGSDLGTGSLILKNGATANVEKISKDKATVTLGTGCTLTCTTADLAINTDAGYEVQYENGVYTAVKAPVAYIGEQGYETVQAAINAAQNGETVTISAGEYSAINISNKNITIQGTVGDNGELLTTIKGGDPAITGHSFNGTIKDIKIVDAWKVMYAEPAGNVTVDNVYVTGATYGFHLVAYSSGLTWKIENSYMDLAWANSFGVAGSGYADIIIRGNEFISTNPFYPDYGAIHVNSFLPSVTVEENIFRENARIYIDKSVTDTSKIKISKNYHADGFENAFADDADGVKVEIDSYYTDVDENGTLTGLVITPGGSINGGLVNVQDPERTFLTIESWIKYANESIVVKVYDANGTLLATSSLIDNDRAILGKENWGGLSTMVGINCTDKWWNTVWETGKLNANYVPAKATLIVDGVEMNTAPIQMRAAGTETEVVWAEVPGVPGAPVAKIGNVDYETLQKAIAAATDGDTINLMCDVTESFSSLCNVTLTTDVEGGVTITNTYEDYVDFNNVTVASGVTLNIPNVYSSGNDSVNVIEGTLNVSGTYYHSSNAKTTIQNGGKVTTIGMTVVRYNSDPDAGIYIYGDNNAETVEFSCANTIGAYSGTFYAEDAVIEANMLWLDYKKGSTEESDIYPEINASFVDSILKVTSELRLYKDSTLTLEGASVTAGKVQVREDATPVVSMDSTSSIKAAAVENLSGAAINAVRGEDGTVTFKKFFAQIGDTKYTSLEEAFKAATANCTIEILSDVTIDYYWDCRYTGSKFTVPVTINGNEHTLKFTETVYDGGNHMAVFRFEDSATVKNLTIDMSEAKSGWGTRFRAISSKAGDLTVDNCKFIGNGSENNTRAIIFGETATAGALTETDIVVTNSEFIGWRNGVIDNETGEPAKEVQTVAIEGNTFTNANVNVSATTSAKFNNNTMNDSWVSITTYADVPKLDVVAKGNELEENGATSTTMNKVNNFATKDVQEGFWFPVANVAEVNGVGYASLQEAVDAAQDGDTVTLIGDIELTERVTVANGQNITLDLNGKTITGTDNATGSFALIEIQPDAELTINDNVGTGKITLTATNNREWNAYSAVISNQRGKLTVNDGTIEHLGGTDMAYGIDNLTNGANTVATTTIKGGTIASTYFAIRQFANNGTNNLVIDGGNIQYVWMQSPNNNANVASTIVTSGTVAGICMSGNNAVYTLEVAAGTTDTVYGTAPTDMVIKGSKDEGWSLKEVTYVAEVNGVKYETLAEAFAVGGDIVLLADVELVNTITVNGNASLDLNGKTISGACNASQAHLIMVANGADMTIKDSSAEQTGKITYEGNNSTGWIVDVEGNLVLESGTLELTGTWSIGYAVDVRPNAWGTAYTEATTFVMDGGKIVSSDGAVRVASSSADSHSNVSASFTMNSGEIEAAWDGVFVQQSNAAWDVLNVTINGGTIKSDLNPVRFYGPTATSYVNGEDCVDIALNGGTLTYTGTDETLVWLVDDILRLGGGVTVDDFLKDASVTASEEFASANVAEGYAWVESNGVYTLEKEEPVAELFYLDEVSATLESSLALNIYLKSSDLTGEDYYAVVEHTKTDGVVTTTIPYTDWTTKEDRKVIHYRGIAAKEMVDNIKITVYHADGTQASMAYDTSLRDYALGMLNLYSQYPAYSHWLPVFVDMLNYGAAAQTIFNHNTSDLASKGAENFQHLASTMPTLDDSGCSATENVYQVSLTLEDMIKLNVFFGDVTEDMKAKYSYTTHSGASIEGEVDFASFKKRIIDGKTYYIVPVDVAVADAATYVTVTLYKGDGSEAGSAVYSANAYLKGMIEWVGAQDEIYPALAKFAASAKSAFAQK